MSAKKNAAPATEATDASTATAEIEYEKPSSKIKVPHTIEVLKAGRGRGVELTILPSKEHPEGFSVIETSIDDAVGAAVKFLDAA